MILVSECNWWGWQLDNRISLQYLPYLCILTSSFLTNPSWPTVSKMAAHRSRSDAQRLPRLRRREVTSQGQRKRPLFNLVTKTPNRISDAGMSAGLVWYVLFAAFFSASTETHREGKLLGKVEWALISATERGVARKCEFVNATFKSWRLFHWTNFHVISRGIAQQPSDLAETQLAKLSLGKQRKDIHRTAIRRRPPCRF